MWMPSEHNQGKHVHAYDDLLCCIHIQFLKYGYHRYNHVGRIVTHYGYRRGFCADTGCCEHHQ